MGASRRMSRPNLVIFDLDDTLYPYAPADAAGKKALALFADRELGVKSSAFSEAFSTARETVKRRVGRTASSHSRLLYCHETLELIGIRSEPQLALAMEQEYWRSYLLAARLRPGALDLLQTLRYHDVVTAIVTDLTAQIQFRKVVHFELTRYIDHIVCSEETALEKESLQPFHVLFERVSPELLESVWFVGDQPFDAPVDELIRSEAIKDGRGFVRGARTSATVTGWSSFAEIEVAVAREFEARA